MGAAGNWKTSSSLTNNLRSSKCCQEASRLSSSGAHRRCRQFFVLYQLPLQFLLPLCSQGNSVKDHLQILGVSACILLVNMLSRKSRKPNAVVLAMSNNGGSIFLDTDFSKNDGLKLPSYMQYELLPTYHVKQVDVRRTLKATRGQISTIQNKSQAPLVFCKVHPQCLQKD